MFKICSISKSFNNFKIDSISFTVEVGEVVALIGKSGSGKSTILRLIADLENRDSGTIEFSEAKKIGYVSQDYNLFPHLTLFENITLVPRIKDLANFTVEAEQYLKEFDLYDHKDKFPAELSGGQRQRGAVIRVLLTDTEILLLDEVTSALDPEATRNILEMVLRLKQKGYSFILASHELGFAERVADRVLFIEDGKISANEPTGIFFKQQANPKIKKFIDNYYF